MISNPLSSPHTYELFFILQLLEHMLTYHHQTMISYFLLIKLIMTQACKIHGTESGFCETRYLPSTYTSATVGDGVKLSYKEALKRATSQWKNNTDGPCQLGQSEFCMPFCVCFFLFFFPYTLSTSIFFLHLYTTQQQQQLHFFATIYIIIIYIFTI